MVTMKALLAVLLVAAPLTVRADAAAFGKCYAALRDAQARGIFHRLAWEAPHRRPSVHVGEGFFELPTPQRQRFAEAVNCYLMVGKTGMCLNINFLHWRGGEQLARFRDCRYLLGAGR